MKNIKLQLFPEEVETWPAERVVGWAAQQFGDGLVLTCSFGGGGIVLAHMLREIKADVPILFLDTGFHFPETLRFKEELSRRLDLNVVDVRPRLTVAEQAKWYGPDLFAREPDLCCRLRKVEPLASALIDLEADAWMAALRRDQSPTRRHIRVAEEHVVAELAETAPDGAPPAPRSRRVVKVHPLASWTRADVWRYLERHRLPYHPLLDEGYTSIGCAPCTRPAVGSDERSGRWAGTEKTECGLHTFTAPPGTSVS